MPKRKLFGNDIAPACAYCHFGKPAQDGIMILCSKFGPVAAYYKCKKYIYDPLKRVPKRLPNLPVFTAEDFQID